MALITSLVMENNGPSIDDINKSMLKTLKLISAKIAYYPLVISDDFEKSMTEKAIKKLKADHKIISAMRDTYESM